MLDRLRAPTSGLSDSIDVVGFDLVGIARSYNSDIGFNN
jgi:hypothetical protein